MAPKNPLKEDDKPQELSDGKTILGTRNQAKKRVILPDGRTLEFVVNENSWRMGDDGVYENAETTPTLIDPSGYTTDFNSGFLCVSMTGVPITSPERLATCTSFFHRNPNRNIYVGLDGSSHGNGQGICNDCQGILNWIYLTLAILGAGVIVGLFRTCSILS